MEKENKKLPNVDDFNESMNVENRSKQLSMQIKEELLNHITIKHRDINAWYEKLKGEGIDVDTYIGDLHLHDRKVPVRDSIVFALLCILFSPLVLLIVYLFMLNVVWYTGVAICVIVLVVIFFCSIVVKIFPADGGLRYIMLKNVNKGLMENELYEAKRLVASDDTKVFDSLKNIVFYIDDIVRKINVLVEKRKEDMMERIKMLERVHEEVTGQLAEVATLPTLGEIVEENTENFKKWEEKSVEGKLL
jgi:hypothetical protein